MPSLGPPRRSPTGRVTAPLALALAATLGSTAARADSIRCDGGPGHSGGIVSTGDSKLDLLGKCGLPALQEDQTRERGWVQVDQAGRTEASRTTVTAVERWTYNFGPRSFVQVVTLEGGVVRSVDRGGYGYDLGPRPSTALAIPRARCDYLRLHEGDTAFEVLARCGEPAARDLKVVTVTRESGGGQQRMVEARTGTVEIWTYDFGPQTLVRRLTVSDGRIVSIETGGYGYSR
jgi:hypothetical protein